VKRLENRVALVTGGGRGIGKAIAARLHQEGARVAICGTTEPVLAAAAAEIGPEVLPIVCDVSDAAAVEAMAGRVRERFGKLDILVNNAALMMRHIGKERAARPFYRLEEADWDRVMAVNVKGVWLCARAALPDMRAQGWGRIINIGSDTVFMGRGNGLQYVASKAAVVGITHALAFEVGRFGITANTISPGMTQTETVEENDLSGLAEQLVQASAIRRKIYAQDIAGTAAWLASDDAALVTGQTTSVNAGLVLR